MTELGLIFLILFMVGIPALLAMFYHLYREDRAEMYSKYDLLRERLNKLEKQ